jgi:hypothetical protein
MILRKIKNKKGIAMSFNWIFAILAGGFILFLAVFSAGKFIRTSEQTLYTETAASLISLFDPLETGLASGKAHEIGFKKKSKIFFDCEENLNPPFGKQTISFSEQTFSDEYGERGQRVSIKNKYIFAEDVVEGDDVYIFSKPFFMPFKVTDLVMVTSQDTDYCFYDSPDDIRESLEGLNMRNIIFMNETNKCEGVDVCFGTSKTSCEVKVIEDQGYLIKRESGKRVYYQGDLIYGAIFSSPTMYECNVKRIKVKFDELAKIYLEKIGIIERKDCISNLGGKLSVMLGGIEDSRALIGLFGLAEDVDSVNRQAKSGCQLYYNSNFDI